MSDAGKYTEKRQLNIRTGSYYRNYRQLDEASALDDSYAARSAHPPKPMGIFLCLRPVLDPLTGEPIANQDFMNDVIVPWKRARRKAGS